jgi:hypothetical protein
MEYVPAMQAVHAEDPAESHPGAPPRIRAAVSPIHVALASEWNDAHQNTCDSDGHFSAGSSYFETCWVSGINDCLKQKRTPENGNQASPRSIKSFFDRINRPGLTAPNDFTCLDTNFLTDWRPPQPQGLGANIHACPPFAKYKLLTPGHNCAICCAVLAMSCT